MDASALFAVFFFLFSSRRRHTRCGRDWSSDVCSSDLHSLLRCRQYNGAQAWYRSSECRPFWSYLSQIFFANFARSEERRVRKECRSRCSRYCQKKKEMDTETIRTMEWRERDALIEPQP